MKVGNVLKLRQQNTNHLQRYTPDTQMSQVNAYLFEAIHAAQSISHSVDRHENISIFEVILFTSMGSILPQQPRYYGVYKCFSADVHTQRPHWLHDDGSNDSTAAIKAHIPRIIVAVDIEFPIRDIHHALLANKAKDDRSADDS